MQIQYDCSLGSFTDRHTIRSMVIARIYLLLLHLTVFTFGCILSHPEREVFYHARTKLTTKKH